jgi:hypothetical protein
MNHTCLFNYVGDPWPPTPSYPFAPTTAPHPDISPFIVHPIYWPDTEEKITKKIEIRNKEPFLCPRCKGEDRPYDLHGMSSCKVCKGTGVVWG